LRVFENRVLRRTFVPKRKMQEAGEVCIMRSFIIYVLQNVIRVINSKRMSWMGNVAHMEGMRNS